MTKPKAPKPKREKRPKEEHPKHEEVSVREFDKLFGKILRAGPMPKKAK
jgi:hypothetical protein